MRHRHGRSGEGWAGNGNGSAGHTQPFWDPADAIEIPSETKRRLGLDDQRSWVVLTEANRFAWPGPDLRPSGAGDLSRAAYGSLPERLFENIRRGLLRNIKAQRVALVSRTE